MNPRYALAAVLFGLACALAVVLASSNAGAQTPPLLDCTNRHDLTVVVRDADGFPLNLEGLRVEILPDPRGYGTERAIDDNGRGDASNRTGIIRVLDACGTVPASMGTTLVGSRYVIRLSADPVRLFCVPREQLQVVALEDDAAVGFDVTACRAITPTATATASPTPTETSAPSPPSPTATAAPLLIVCPSGLVVDILRGNCPPYPVSPAPRENPALSPPASAPTATTAAVPAPGAPAIRPPQTGDGGLR